VLLRPLGEQVVLITGATGGLGWDVTGELESVRATVLLQTWPLSPPRPGLLRERDRYKHHVRPRGRLNEMKVLRCSCRMAQVANMTAFFASEYTATPAEIVFDLA
jgi:NAD(P)-dependent dehydrogenase (short-subunit alcohol dehydrogenase family)